MATLILPAERPTLLRRALKVFRKLTNPLSPGGIPLVTGIEVLGAEGLAFTFVQKAGIGVYGMGGHGFVVRKARPALVDRRIIDLI